MIKSKNERKPQQLGRSEYKLSLYENLDDKASDYSPRIPIFVPFLTKKPLMQGRFRDLGLFKLEIHFGHSLMTFKKRMYFLGGSQMYRYQMNFSKMRPSVVLTEYSQSVNCVSAMALIGRKRMLSFNVATQGFEVYHLEKCRSVGSMSYNKEYRENGVTRKTAPQVMKFMKGIVALDVSSSRALAFDEANGFVVVNTKTRSLSPVMCYQRLPKSPIYEFFNIRKNEFLASTRRKVFHVSLLRHVSENKVEYELVFRKVFGFPANREIIMKYYRGFVFACQKGDFQLRVVHLASKSRAENGGEGRMEMTKTHLINLENNRDNSGHGNILRFNIQGLYINARLQQIMIIQEFRVVKEMYISHSQPSNNVQSIGQTGQGTDSIFLNNDFVGLQTMTSNVGGNRLAEETGNEFENCKARKAKLDGLEEGMGREGCTIGPDLVRSIKSVKLPVKCEETYKTNYKALFYDIMHIIPERFIRTVASKQTRQEANRLAQTPNRQQVPVSKQKDYENVHKTMVRLFRERERLRRCSGKTLNIFDIYDFDSVNNCYEDCIDLGSQEPKVVALMEKGEYFTVVDVAGGFRTFLWGMKFENTTGRDFKYGRGF